MTKVIAKFTDGSTYTWKGVWVDGRPEWVGGVTKLWRDEDWSVQDSVIHSEDLLCLMQKDEGYCIVWTNPKYENVCIEVETGKKRGSYDKIKKSKVGINEKAVQIVEKFCKDFDDIIEENSSIWSVILKWWRG